MTPTLPPTPDPAAAAKAAVLNDAPLSVEDKLSAAGAARFLGPRVGELLAECWECDEVPDDRRHVAAWALRAVAAAVEAAPPAPPLSAGDKVLADRLARHIAWAVHSLLRDGLFLARADDPRGVELAALRARLAALGAGDTKGGQR